MCKLYAALVNFTQPCASGQEPEISMDGVAPSASMKGSEVSNDKKRKRMDGLLSQRFVVSLGVRVL